MKKKKRQSLAIPPIGLIGPRGGPVTLQIAKDALSLVGCDFAFHDRSPLQSELDFAYDYAIREHLAASDNPVRRVRRPSFIREDWAL